MATIWRVVAALGVLAGVAVLVILLPLLADRNPVAGFMVVLGVFLTFTYATMFALRSAGTAAALARTRRSRRDQT